MRKPSHLDILRLQQRLRFLGFPGWDGNAVAGANGNPAGAAAVHDPLVVDGRTGDQTRWAIGLFSHAVLDSSEGRNNWARFPDATLVGRAERFINAITRQDGLSFRPTVQIG